MTQMGGLDSHGCAGMPSPRDFGHFASPSWLIMKQNTRYTLKLANEGEEILGVLESVLCMND